MDCRNFGKHCQGRRRVPETRDPYCQSRLSSAQVTRLVAGSYPHLRISARPARSYSKATFSSLRYVRFLPVVLHSACSHAAFEGRVGGAECTGLSRRRECNAPPTAARTFIGCHHVRLLPAAMISNLPNPSVGHVLSGEFELVSSRACAREQTLCLCRERPSEGIVSPCACASSSCSRTRPALCRRGRRIVSRSGCDRGGWCDRRRGWARRWHVDSTCVGRENSSIENAGSCSISCELNGRYITYIRWATRVSPRPAPGFDVRRWRAPEHRPVIMLLAATRHAVDISVLVSVRRGVRQMHNRPLYNTLIMFINCARVCCGCAPSAIEGASRFPIFP